MEHTLQNPKRHKTIREMEDGEIGYISEDSLCYDFQEETREAIYAVFHYDRYSSQASNSDEESSIKYDIQITCNIVDGERIFTVINPYYYIERSNLAIVPNKDYTIVSTKEEIVTIFNANENHINTQEFDKFIECILSNTEHDESKAEIYNAAQNNFSYVMVQYCKEHNWENVESILFNLHHIINNSNTDREEILEVFSDYNTIERYILELEEPVLSGYIDQEVTQIIDSIAGIFNETFCSDDTLEEEQLKENPEHPIKTLKELQDNLKEAVKTEDYEQATKIREEIAKRGGSTNE